MGLGEEHLGNDLPTALVQALAQVDLELVTQSIDLLLGLLRGTPEEHRSHARGLFREDPQTGLQL